MKAPLVICSTLLLAALVAESHFAQDAGTLRRAALYGPLMDETGERHGVDPRLLWTIAFLETRFRPGLVSPAGARGLMQFVPATAARFGLTDPHDAAGALDAAARYLRLLQVTFGHCLDLVLAAYNAGEGAVAAFRDGRRLMLSNGKVINPNGLKTGGVPPYRETRGYVREGLALFRRLSDKSEPVLSRQSVRPRPVGSIRSEETPGASPGRGAQAMRGSIYAVVAGAGEAPDLTRPPRDQTTRSTYPE